MKTAEKGIHDRWRVKYQTTSLSEVEQQQWNIKEATSCHSALMKLEPVELEVLLKDVSKKQLEHKINSISQFKKSEEQQVKLKDHGKMYIGEEEKKKKKQKGLGRGRVNTDIEQ